MSCGGKRGRKKADRLFEDGYCSCFQQREWARVCVLVFLSRLGDCYFHCESHDFAKLLRNSTIRAPRLGPTKAFWGVNFFFLTCQNVQVSLWLQTVCGETCNLSTSEVKTENRRKTLAKKKNSFVVSSLLCFVLILFQMCFLFQQKGERDVIFFFLTHHKKHKNLSNFKLWTTLNNSVFDVLGSSALPQLVTSLSRSATCLSSDAFTCKDTCRS